MASVYIRADSFETEVTVLENSDAYSLMSDGKAELLSALDNAVQKVKAAYGLD